MQPPNNTVPPSGTVHKFLKREDILLTTAISWEVLKQLVGLEYNRKREFFRHLLLYAIVSGILYGFILMNCDFTNMCSNQSILPSRWGSGILWPLQSEHSGNHFRVSIVVINCRVSIVVINMGPVGPRWAHVGHINLAIRGATRTACLEPSETISSLFVRTTLLHNNVYTRFMQ